MIHYFKSDVYRKYKGYFKALAEMLKQYKKIDLNDKTAQNLYFNSINLALREVSSSYYKAFLNGYYYSKDLDEACFEYTGKHFSELSKSERKSIGLVYTEEHINDIKSIIDDNLIKLKRITAKSVFDFLDTHLAIAFIFKEEDIKLNKLAKTGRLKDTNTRFTYYTLAKIDLLYAEWK